MDSGSLKHLWETWDIRVVILLSLFLQVFLILSAPLRKRMSDWYVSIPIWTAYLCADVAAIYAVGLISRSFILRAQGTVSPDLKVFWAPFLLVHLGGPDTITAFAREDNEFWLRHLLSLISQSVLVIYVFCTAFPNNKVLLLPAVLIFLSGCIKYSERIRCLYYASSDAYRESFLGAPNPGSDYAKLMNVFLSRKDAGLPTSIHLVPKPPRREKKNRNLGYDKRLSDLEVVRSAHGFFKRFKRLIAGLMFRFKERQASRDFFLKRNSWEAFKIVEVELNLMYEILYTKAPVVQSMLGYLCRFACLGLTSAAFLLFNLKERKEDVYHKFDMVTTYVLLVGAIALDLIAFAMVLFSDWTAVALSEPDTGQYIASELIKRTQIKTILRKLLRVDRTRWPREHGTKEMKQKRYSLMEVIRQRWSNTVSQYNLIDCCLRPRPKFMRPDTGFIGLTRILDSIQYVVTKELEENLRDAIFREIRVHAEMAEDMAAAREIYSARGNWILRFTGNAELLPWIDQFDYDKSLIMWHIATDLLYSTTDDEIPRGSDTEFEFRCFSKILSDHMLYLLIMQTNMMSTVAATGLVRFRDTCSETIRFFSQRNIKKSDRAIACKSILSVETVVKPVAVKEARSKALLFDASMLAKELRKLRKEDKWEIIFRVWVELMCYAASHCRPSAHATELSKGGQLITLVWLLMTHFGLGNQFQTNDQTVTAKMIFGK